MCSIIGAIGHIDNKLLSDIFYQSKIRGLHCFGISYLHKGNIETYKTHSLQKMINKIKNIDTTLLIGHCRYSTSGDYKDLNNNQPLQFKAINLAFNGVLSMKSTIGMESEFEVKIPNENDGYVLIQKLYDDNILNHKDYSFACVYIENNRLCAIRNENRPAYQTKHNNCTYIASTRDIFARSGIKDCEELEPLKRYEY